MPDFRVIPSIEHLRQRPGVRRLLDRYGHAAVVQALRDEVDLLRRRIAGERDADAGPGAAELIAAGLESAAEARLARLVESSLQPVINATGVIIHTNLGRAPLSGTALDQVVEVAARYSTLEFDLDTGGRGHRDRHAEHLLRAVTGAEAAAVVNNNAAATLIALAALAAGREVVVSRGELVEIGGGFRIPDVMAQSGAVLHEVGTTNRTRAADYEAAITDRTALLLRVHRSNFTIEGFTEQPALADLVAIGRARGIPVGKDLGSGNVAAAMIAAGRLEHLGPEGLPWLEGFLRDEPTVQGSLAAGADLVWISGDKLLGGPQAGIILGRRDLVARIQRHPLMRALRVDKLTYAALTGTLIDYATGRAGRTVPVLDMLTRAPEAIGARATQLAALLSGRTGCQGEVIDGRSAIGGGTTPGVTIPTRLLALTHPRLSADAIQAALRRLDPPVIARIEHDRVVLDLRTVFEDEDGLVAEALASLTA
jgi:L-seryl-tRNA(Ser) seleniumtransferase